MPAKTEVIGEGNLFKIRVTMQKGEASHDLAHDESIARLPEGVWILEKYVLDGSGENTVATCQYRETSVETFGPGPVEVVVVGDKDVKITRIPARK